MGSGRRRHNDDKKTVLQSLSMITQFGLSMLVPVMICSFGGYYLDRKLGTSFLAILLFFVGAVAGAWNVFVMIRKMNQSDGKK